MSATTKPRITKHQRETLLRLGRMSVVYRNPDGSRATGTRSDYGLSGDGPLPSKWILDRNCGGPAALHHLYGKGVVERDIRTGPRGGEHVYYRPNAAGWEIIDRARERAATTPVERRQTTGEIDSRLIEARCDEKVARVYVGPAAAEIRGYVGALSRNDSGVLTIEIGKRRIALASIVEVVVEEGRS